MNKKILVFLILIYVLLNIPFNFIYFVFGGPNPWFLFFVLVLIVLDFSILYNGKVFLKRQELFAALFLFLYSVVRLLIGGAQFSSWLVDLVNIIFIICLYDVVIIDRIVLRYLWKFFSSIIIICSICVNLLFALYNVFPSFFSYESIGDYKMAVFPLLGNVYVGGHEPRYCWYFAEPSYLGFFLALYLLVLLIIKPNKYKLKTVLVISAGFLSGAMTFWLCLICSAIIGIIKIFVPIRSYIYRMFFAVFILILLIVILTFDFEEFVLYYDIFERNSFGDRQYRMLLSKDIMEKMSFFDYLLGKGSNYVAMVYGSGESNSYYKLVVEYGVLFTVIITYYLNRFIKNDLFFVAVVSGLMTVILFLTPFLWMFVFLLYGMYLNSKTFNITK